MCVFWPTERGTGYCFSPAASQINPIAFAFVLLTRTHAPLTFYFHAHWHTRDGHTDGNPALRITAEFDLRQLSLVGVGSQCFNLTLGFTLMQTHSDSTIFLSFRFPAAMLARWSRIYMCGLTIVVHRFLGGASGTPIQHHRHCDQMALLNLTAIFT